MSYAFGGTLILTMQVWFDDSGGKRQGRWMSMSGLFGEAQAIATLADNWDKYCRAKYPGSIQYFKMDEACGFKGQFADWKTENRDKKVWQLATLIDQSGLLEIAARVNIQAFEKISPR
jgi:hypothetical protein